MTLKFDLDPTVPRVVIIGILLFVEALVLPAYTILQTGEVPTEVQWMMFFVGAVLQLVTYLLSFMGFKTTEEEGE